MNDIAVSVVSHQAPAMEEDEKDCTTFRIQYLVRCTFDCKTTESSRETVETFRDALQLCTELALSDVYQLCQLLFLYFCCAVNPATTKVIPITSPVYLGKKGILRCVQHAKSDVSSSIIFNDLCQMVVMIMHDHILEKNVVSTLHTCQRHYCVTFIKYLAAIKFSCPMLMETHRLDHFSGACLQHHEAFYAEMMAMYDAAVELEINTPDAEWLPAASVVVINTSSSRTFYHLTEINVCTLHQGKKMPSLVQEPSGKRIKIMD